MSHHHNPDDDAKDAIPPERLQRVYAEAAALLCDRWRARDVVPDLVREIWRLRRRAAEIRAGLPGPHAVDPETPEAD